MFANFRNGLANLLANRSLFLVCTDVVLKRSSQIIAKKVKKQDKTFQGEILLLKKKLQKEEQFQKKN